MRVRSKLGIALFSVLYLYFVYFDLAFCESKFKETISKEFFCLGDDDPKCVQGVAHSKLPCIYHDDCVLGCTSGSQLSLCFHKTEVDDRIPKSNEKGIAQKLPNACLINSVQKADCGCLPQSKRCGQMTEKYLKSAQAKGNIIGIDFTERKFVQKKVICKSDGDCSKICKDSTKGFGGIPCGCLKDVFLCGYGFEITPEKTK